MNARLSLTTLLALPLLACGGGNSGTDTADAKVFKDAPAVDAPFVCPVPTTLDSLGPTFPGGTGAVFEGSDSTDPLDAVIFFGDTTTEESTDFEYQLVFVFGGGPGSGSDATPDWPTSFGPKSGVSLGSAVDTVAFVIGDFTGSGSDEKATVEYETTTTGGTLNLTQAGSAAGAAIVGTVTDFEVVQLNEVNGTTPNTDNCAEDVTTFSMNTTIEGSGSGSAAFAPTQSAQPRYHLSKAEIRSALEHRIK